MKSLHQCIFLCLLAILFLNSCDKVTYPLEDEIKPLLIGKWRTASVDGVAITTNEMKVGTFATDEIYYSTWSEPPFWYNKYQWKYSVHSNTVTYVNAEDDEYIEKINSISSTKMVTTDSYWKLHPEKADKGLTEYLHIACDYSRIIVGLWEGVKITGDETYGNADHRWNFYDNGTFTYYNMDGKGGWIKSDNTQNDYVADGDYLAFRWKDKTGTEYREWWLIETCNDTKMVWTALRAKDDGTRFSTSFELKRVSQ